jgi:hypothetical protein
MLASADDSRVNIAWLGGPFVWSTVEAHTGQLIPEAMYGMVNIQQFLLPCCSKVIKDAEIGLCSLSIG